jgi:hypothetical protein
VWISDDADHDVWCMCDSSMIISDLNLREHVPILDAMGGILGPRYTYFKKNLLV